MPSYGCMSAYKYIFIYTVLHRNMHVYTSGHKERESVCISKAKKHDDVCSVEFGAETDIENQPV